MWAIQHHNYKTYQGHICHRVDDNSLVLHSVLSDSTQPRFQHMVPIKERLLCSWFHPHLKLKTTKFQVNQGTHSTMLLAEIKCFIQLQLLPQLNSSTYQSSSCPGLCSNLPHDTKTTDHNLTKSFSVTQSSKNSPDWDLIENPSCGLQGEASMAWTCVSMSD